MKNYIFFLVLILFGSSLSAQTKERKGYLGIVIGPSFPISDFATNSFSTEYQGIPKLGYSDSFIDFGYLFGKNIGISASVAYTQYLIDNSTSDLWWGIASITAGPMFSLPLSEKFFIDIKANAGIVFANFIIDEILYSEFGRGIGIGIDLRASLRYNVYRRWYVMAESGYLSSNQSFMDDSKRKIQNINLGFGIALSIK